MEKTLKPAKVQFSNYQSLYDYFNAKLFKNELPDCMLNLSRKQARNGGHFSPNRWEGKGIETHEINLNPVFFRERTDKEIVSVLVHEMAHLWQQEFGKPSRAGYHDKEWGTKMKEIGLHPSNTGEVGGKETGQQMTHYIIENGAFEKAFAAMPEKLLLPFRSFENDKQKPKAKSKIKYTCDVCGCNVWGKPDLAILCFECINDGEDLGDQLMKPE